MFCSHCGAQIAENVDACPKCGRSANGIDDGEKAEKLVGWIVPINRSDWAITAGYLGLLAVIPGIGILAIICGRLALKAIEKDPRKRGKGRAYFGIFSGMTFTVIEAVMLIAMLICRFLP